MALNKSLFITRATTAVVFAIVMLGGLLWNGYSFLILFSVIACGCLYEFRKLTREVQKISEWAFFPLAVLYILFPLFLLVDLGLNGNKYIHVSTENVSLSDYSPLLPCSIIFSIWINDTMAYIVGSLIGKTPLSSISPKKTWEGTIGGILLSVIVIGIAGSLLSVTKVLHWSHWAAIASIAAFFGTLGDLLESKIKREAGVKDSGSFMPGHGGFLDRFDSLLFSIPFVWIYIHLIA